MDYCSLNDLVQYGVVSEVRIATGEDGKCKGFAFVDFEQEVRFSWGPCFVSLSAVRLSQQDAQAALTANNHELKRRRIAVTLTDSRVRPRNRFVPDQT
jgi:hypothetical protein